MPRPTKPKATKTSGLKSILDKARKQHKDARTAAGKSPVGVATSRRKKAPK